MFFKYYVGNSDLIIKSVACILTFTINFCRQQAIQPK